MKVLVLFVTDGYPQMTEGTIRGRVHDDPAFWIFPKLKIEKWKWLVFLRNLTSSAIRSAMRSNRHVMGSGSRQFFISFTFSARSKQAIEHSFTPSYGHKRENVDTNVTNLHSLYICLQSNQMFTVPLKRFLVHLNIVKSIKLLHNQKASTK